MNIINQIEKSFAKSKEIGFFPTLDYSIGPAVVMLIFDNPMDGSIGYNFILDNFKDNKASLVIFEKEKTLDISIVIKETADAVNIKNLSFDHAQLRDFLIKEPKERRFAFLIGSMEESEAVPFATREPFSIVLLDKFEIK